MIKESEYFIICPRCKRKADAEVTGNRFHAKCKCGAEYWGDFAKEPMTDAEVKKAMEKLKGACTNAEAETDPDT